jgi:hypothetical protein
MLLEQVLCTKAVAIHVAQLSAAQAGGCTRYCCSSIVALYAVTPAASATILTDAEAVAPAQNYSTCASVHIQETRCGSL